MMFILLLIRTFWPLVLFGAVYAYLYFQVPVFDPKSDPLGVAIMTAKIYLNPVAVVLLGIPVCIFLRAKEWWRRLKFIILAGTAAAIAAAHFYLFN